MSRYIWAHLGHCVYCMRTSFTSAVMAAIATGILWRLLSWTSPATRGAALVSAALFLLWIAHLIAYASKSVARVRYTNPQRATLPNRGLGVDYERRGMLRSFAITFGTAALITAAPRSVLADNLCTCRVCQGIDADACCNGTSTNSANCSCSNQANVKCSLCC